MIFDFVKKPRVSLYASRRKSLVQSIKDNFGTEGGLTGSGVIVLISDFHKENVLFEQESSFYYFTGIEEPGVILLIDMAGKEAGKTTLYIPQYAHDRIQSAQGVAERIDTSKESATRLGVDAVVWLGEFVQESHVGPFSDLSLYKSLVERLKMAIASDSNSNIYTLMPTDSHSHVDQRLFLMRLTDSIPSLARTFVDVSNLVTDLRSSKDMSEIELMQGAVGVGMVAHEAAAHMIGDQVSELDIRAGLESVVTMTGGCMALPTSIASGSNNLIVGYTKNDSILATGQLVTVNVGVKYAYYTANLARTYPVSGVFSKQQRVVYDVLVAAHEYISDLIQPGYWISNESASNKSLFHLLKVFFARYHYEQYFMQDIAHHIGLDIDDNVDINRALRTGDVIVLTLGLCIPKDSISMMVKDVYWVVKQGAINMSQELPVQAEEVEIFMKEQAKQGGESEDLFEDYQEDDLDSYDFSNEDDVEH